ncbi:MAG: CYTH domain-containing protein [Candidatus Cohnella colombiensis]|uniref:CYTH domain-containing protein n=1 Tax=Candidatus Cohnella colombiensis TaxID=3121368 RepID=A0AA95EY85_9BACL|nr:MAG: CYTH domain-containing protein [Cohnella sp.]
MLEIERKFLLPHYPDKLISSGTIVVQSEHFIDQTYLALDPDQELRVRKIVDAGTGEATYTHTFKRGNGLMREEVEYSISESIYTQVIEAFKAKPLTKKRVTAVWEGITVEIDCYDQLNLIVIEVEFNSKEAALSFNAPEWFGPDISSERQYSNKTIWRKLQES